MKKIIFSFLLFTFIFNTGKSQFVEIPDSNFRNFLMRRYPLCFNENKQMDTTCNPIKNEDVIYLDGKEIWNLEGIKYFKKLTFLNCSNNHLTYLPELPKYLTRLDCSYNKLNNLPDLPNSIFSFSCAFNELISLPSLPDSLIEFWCQNNRIIEIPNLPKKLNKIYCSDNNIITLPSLPNSLYFLDCYNNKIIEFPSLPNSLIHLNFYNNKLINLPTLPNSLSLLNSGKNNIGVLPLLPNSLTYIRCTENQLSILPNLPKSLSYIDCAFNNLNNLPNLPNSLGALYCQNNPLKCLPKLPNSLQVLRILGTEISCLPNKNLNLSVDTILPICTDPSDICQVYTFVKGFVYNDANNNSVYDSLTETPIPNQIITVSPNEWIGSSNLNGEYWVSLDTAINNTWSCSTVDKYSNFSPNSYSATPTGLGLLPNDYNFGFQFKPNIKDLEATLAGTAVRPGFSTNVALTANNIGTINQSNITVKLKKPAGYDTLATSIPPNFIIDDTLFWENISIDFLKSESFYVELQVPVSEVLGTEIIYEAWVNSLQSDTTPIDNYAKWTEIARGSFDPNDKLVSKTTLPPAYDIEKDRLIYTIRFQNTGTDTAFYVRVKDEMPANLNLSTLRVINASHAYQLIVREKNVVEFAFPNILLPNSSTNEPKSHGFVQFSIQPKAGLPINTKIENNAAIYFDYNAPVITNFAKTEVKLTTGLASNKNLDFKLYPNPTNGTVRLELPYSGEGNWMLSDISGRQIKTNYIANGEKVMELNLSDLPSGTYFITIQLGGNVSTAKVIKIYDL